jgi:DnaK suppressor protein
MLSWKSWAALAVLFDKFILLSTLMAYKPVQLSPNYTPSVDEEYMGPLQVEYFRQKLVAWKDDLARESQITVDHLKDENWNEPDLNDRATVETETSLELRTRDRYRKLMAKIDAALSRIEAGEYGYCEDTGEPIGVKRLEARPIATLSIEAQERHERFEKTHSDE